MFNIYDETQSPQKKGILLGELHPQNPFKQRFFQKIFSWNWVKNGC